MSIPTKTGVGFMAKIKPIPKKLLTHTIQYEEWFNDDGYGSSYKNPITINFVRVDPSSAIARSNIRDDVEANSVIFIDRIYSQPFIELKEKSRVTFEGKPFEVTKTNPFYDFLEVPHHYEVLIQ